MDADVKTLLECVEAAFEIKFRPSELSDHSYFSDLCTAVQAHVAHKPADRRFSSQVFWRLRRACLELFDSPRASIRPSTTMDSLLPSFRRRRAWFALSAASGLKLPGLEYSSFRSSLIFVGGLLPAIPLATSGVSWGFALASILLWPISTTVLFHVARPFASELSAGSQTLGQLTKTVVGLNHGQLVREFGASRESETLEALRYVIGDLIDIDPYALVGKDPHLIDLALENDGFRAHV